MSRSSSKKFKGCIVGKIKPGMSQSCIMLPSIWKVPMMQDKDERDRDEMKIVIKEIRVLKKYKVKIVIKFTTRINKHVLEFNEADFMITLDEKDFADHFPKTFSQLIFKHLLDDGKARRWISSEDFTSKVPDLASKYSNAVPSLSYKKPYVVLMQTSGFHETRRRIAQYFRFVEAYEEKLNEETSE